MDALMRALLKLLFAVVAVSFLAGCQAAGAMSQQTGASSTTPFSVSNVDLAVAPASIAGMACGSSVTFTYTATFHVPAGTTGGAIQFAYTLNNGRSSTPASVAVSPGQTTQTYAFTSSGTLSPDHTYPGVAEVLVTSPNAVHSQQVKPSGACGAVVPFQVASVDLAVSPDSIAGMACGSSVTFTYTATFHVAPGGPGGTIQFSYTVNNGREQTNASVQVSPGQTTATSTFTSSGKVGSQYAYPGIAEVLVSSPNAVPSSQVQPSGSCASATAFQVTSVEIAVSPTSVVGKACGTQITVTYTATFHIAPGSPGGTIQFQYTVNNGRSSTAASITVVPGQTTATYHFTWSGALPPDHTYPAAGGVMVTIPDQIISPLVAPTGSCS
jgi:hypothetical protein